MKYRLANIKDDKGALIGVALQIKPKGSKTWGTDVLYTQPSPNMPAKVKEVEAYGYEFAGIVDLPESDMWESTK